MELRNLHTGNDSGSALKPVFAPPSGSSNGESHEYAAHRPGKAQTAHLPTVDLLNVKIHCLSEQQTIDTILHELRASRGGTVITPNLDHLHRFKTDVSFSALVNESDLVVADGMPLVWASRLQGTPLPQRVAGSNMITSLSAAAAEQGRRIFMLGGAPGTADGAAKILCDRIPGLKVVGTHCPPMGFENNPKEMVEIVAALVSAQPDIVYVALGSPKQEYLIARLRRTLPQAWWLGVGVSFSFLCGDVRRAPVWMQKTGLEWMHRLIQEPRRLFRRYIVVGIPFASELLLRSTYRGVKQRLKIKQYATLGTERTLEKPLNGNGHPLAIKVNEPLAVLLADVTADPFPRSRIDRKPQRDGSALPKIKALVLLGGAVRPSPIGSAIGRSVLDLPMDHAGSILGHWLQHAAQVAQQAGIEQLPVRVLVDRNSPEPVSANLSHYGAFRVERDQSEYRGTGGVLKDLADEYDDDAFLLVANAAQILLDPLAAIARTLDQKRADVGLVSHREGTPSGIMLICVKALRLIPDLGFVDMKEQAMPLIARENNMAVLHRRRPTGMPIRTRQDYILALRYHHSLRQNKATLNDPLAEDWKPAFSIIEEGASVDPTARLHDSVVLKGATVEPGAVLVRSVVCPAAVVKKDRTIVDDVLTRAATQRVARLGI